MAFFTFHHLRKCNQKCNQLRRKPFPSRMKQLSLLLLLLVLGACGTPSGNHRAPISFNGSYAFSSQARIHSKHRVIRDGWTQESWRLEIDGTKGQLEFREPRGLYYCQLAVRVHPTGGCAIVLFDSIRSKALLADEQISTLRKGDFLLKLRNTSHGPMIVKQQITHFQGTNRGSSLTFIEKTGTGTSFPR